jgi:hypothetical protein
VVVEQVDLVERPVVAAAWQDGTDQLAYGVAQAPLDRYRTVVAVSSLVKALGGAAALAVVLAQGTIEGTALIQQASQQQCIEDTQVAF